MIPFSLIQRTSVIGIESKGDGGKLFTLAIVVFAASLILLILHRKEGIKIASSFLPQKSSIGLT